MVQVRVVVCVILFFGIILDVFHHEIVNVTILAMVKSRYTDDGVVSIISNRNRSAPACVVGESLIKDLFLVENYTGKLEDKIEKLMTRNKNRLDWNESEQKLVLGASYWFHWFGNMFAGLLTHRFGAKVMLILSMTMCTVISFLIPTIAYISPTLVAWLRAIQGFFAILLLPVGAITVIGMWSPLEERGRFMSVMIAVPLGASLGYLMFSFISERLGWQYTFHLTGVLSLFWIISCWYFIYDTPRVHPRIKDKEKNYILASLDNSVSAEKLPIPWKQILTSWPFHLIILNHIGFMWSYTLMNAYAPTYFQEVFGFSTELSGVILGISYFLRAILCYVGGIVSDSIIKKKCMTLTNLRKMWTVLGAIIPAMSFLMVIFCSCNCIVSIIGIVTNLSFSSFFTVGTSTSVIDISPNFCNILQSICSSISFSTGVFLALLIQINANNNVDVYTQWQIIFLVSVIIQILPALGFVIFGTSEVQPWNNPSKNKALLKKNFSKLYKILPTNNNEALVKRINS